MAVSPLAKLARLRSRCRAAQAASYERLYGVFRSYRIPAIGSLDHAQAVGLLVDFARQLVASLRGIPAECVHTADAADALERWLSVSGHDLKQAVLMMTEPGAEPDALLERLGAAVLAEAIARAEQIESDHMLRHATFSERLRLVQALRREFPDRLRSFGSLPDWSLVPVLHQLVAPCEHAS